MNVGPTYKLRDSNFGVERLVRNSFPNVFMALPEESGGYEDYNNHFFSSLDYRSDPSMPATNFLIAEKDESDVTGYKVYSHPLYLLGNNGGYYTNTNKNSIYAEANNYYSPASNSRMTIGLEMVPLGNTLIRHTYTVENTSKNSITFIAMKDLTVQINEYDTAIEGNNKYVDKNPQPVDMKMLGVNEGISTEDKGYRVNYLFRNTPNGPDNFSSFGVPSKYRIDSSMYKTDDDHFNSPLPNPDAKWLYNPYTGNTIHGKGMEVENYQPNQVLKPNSYSNPNRNGIAMKWDEVTLGPGEYKDFSYDVQMYGDFGMTYLFHNKDMKKENQYNPGDTVVLQPAGNWNNQDYKLSEGVISTTISDGITLKSNDDVVVKATGTSGNGLDVAKIKTVKVKDVYDKESRILSVPISKDEVADIDPKTNSVGLEFNGLLNEKSENRVLTQEGTVEFKDEKSGEIYKRNQPIYINVGKIKGILPASYDLEVSKKVEHDTYFVGDTVNYEIVASNLEDSTGTLINGKLVDTLPNGLSKPSDIKVNNKVIESNKIEWNENARELVLDLEDISLGETKTITYQTQIESGEANEIKTNHVVLSGESADDVEDDASFTVEEKIKHTVEFNTTGGSEVDSVEVIDDETVDKPNDPIFENRVFLDWYTDKELTKKYDFKTPVKNSMTLYAKWQSQVLDPTNPAKPVEPMEPNQNEGDLKIAHVSTFDFGIQENNKHAFTAKSNPDTVKENGEDKKVPSCVSIIDDRGQKEPWELSAKSSGFKNDKGKELKNASLILSDLNYQGNQKNPIVTKGKVNLSNDVPQKIAYSEKDTEGTSWSLAMGSLKNNDVTGVSLEVPFGAYKDPSKYKATIDWNLTSKVSN